MHNRICVFLPLNFISVVKCDNMRSQNYTKLCDYLHRKKNKKFVESSLGEVLKPQNKCLMPDKRKNINRSMPSDSHPLWSYCLMPYKKTKKRKRVNKQVPDTFKMAMGLGAFALATPIAVQALKNLSSN